MCILCVYYVYIMCILCVSYECIAASTAAVAAAAGRRWRRCTAIQPQHSGPDAALAAAFGRLGTALGEPQIAQWVACSHGTVGLTFGNPMSKKSEK